jgi:hypothetical protein
MVLILSGTSDEVKLEPELFLSYGDLVLIESTTCYFLRQDSPIDASVANDSSLLYGELSASPLQMPQTSNQQMDFNLELSRYIQLQSCISSFSGVLELRRPSIKILRDTYLLIRDISLCEYRVIQSWFRTSKVFYILSRLLLLIRSMNNPCPNLATRHPTSLARSYSSLLASRHCLSHAYNLLPSPFKP